MDTVLSTFDLTKRFGGRPAVDHVNMTIRKGDIYGFVGKNGAGKTTLMRMILSHAIPSEGRFELFGEAPKAASYRRVGSLVESPGFYKNCTARENLERHAILYGAGLSEVDGVLRKIGLEEAGNKKAGKFSLGMKQRLGIGIALLDHPEFIVLDEPVNGLDPGGILEVRNLIQQLNREEGVTFLISSHLLDELAKLATVFGMIRDGRLIEEDSAQAIKERCGQRLRIVVEEPDRAYALLRQQMPQIEIEQRDYALLIRGHGTEAAAINRLLVQEDLSVISVGTETGGLEEYIIERIGG